MHNKYDLSFTERLLLMRLAEKRMAEAREMYVWWDNQANARGLGPNCRADWIAARNVYADLSRELGRVRMKLRKMEPKIARLGGHKNGRQ